MYFRLLYIQYEVKAQNKFLYYAPGFRRRPGNIGSDGLAYPELVTSGAVLIAVGINTEAVPGYRMWIASNGAESFAGFVGKQR
ncbi:MAG: hypothetical protein CMN76_19595 [Spirochaetaceae bacterium]|nr:hypothetical protein [Spirochaetaceae bacterium]|tara:strand:- start:43328 stop:43576 length:249 start_codon:yes stop_codon:yes gene_type:complete